MIQLLAGDCYSKLRSGHDRKSPQPQDPDDRLLFQHHDPLRIMTVLIDYDLKQHAEQDPALAYLLGLIAMSSREFAGRPPVLRSFWHADDGPPHTVPRRTQSQSGIEFVPEWIQVHQSNLDQGLSITYSKGDRVHSTALWLNAFVLDATDREPVPMSYSSLSDPIAQMKSDVVAAFAAAALKADVFVTRREFLFDTRLVSSLKTLFLGPTEALWLIGLYLRQQGTFVTSVSPDGRSSVKTNSSSFYALAALELVPALQRWRAAFDQHGSASGNVAIPGLVYTSTMRLAQAFQARDRLHTALFGPQNTQGPIDALAQLDQINLLLMAAFDNAARVAHHLLNLTPEKIRNAGWQRKDWRSLVGSRSPALSSLVSPGSTGHHVLTILTGFRNTIHAELPPLLTVKESAAPPDTRVALPIQEAASMLTAMDALGGRLEWGVDDLGAHSLPRTFIRPGMFVEQLLQQSTALLDSLFAPLPAQWLQQAEAQRGEPLHPSNLVDSHSPDFGKEIRWQLGL